MDSDSGSAAPARPSLLERAVVALNAIGSLWVLILVLLICADSFGRSFLDHPIEGVVELVAVSMAVIVFCQLPDSIRLDKLTRSDTFLPMLSSSRSIVPRLLVCGYDILGVAVMVLILRGTTPMMVESYERTYYIGTKGIFTFPDWPLKAMVVLGCVASILCFLVRAGEHWRSSAPRP